MTTHPLELAERLEAIKADHLTRAQVCAGKKLLKRTAFHYDAANAMTQAASYIRAKEGETTALRARTDAATRDG